MNPNWTDDQKLLVMVVDALVKKYPDCDVVKAVWAMSERVLDDVALERDDLEGLIFRAAAAGVPDTVSAYGHADYWFAALQGQANRFRDEMARIRAGRGDV